jgi:hypothetical protein
LYPPADALDCLPCKVINGSVEVLLSAEEWAKILRKAAARMSNPKRLCSRVRHGVVAALKAAGIDLTDVYGPEMVQTLQIVESAPACIRKADFLSLDEQVWLATATATAPEEIVLRAKELTCEHIQKDRQDREMPSRKSRPAEVATTSSVEVTFKVCVERLIQEKQAAEEDELFADRDRLLAAVIDKLASAKPFSKAIVEDRPAKQVLKKRLQSLAPAEFEMLAAAVLRAESVVPMTLRWLKAVGGRPSTSGSVKPQPVSNDPPKRRSRRKFRRN